MAEGRRDKRFKLSPAECWEIKKEYRTGDTSYRKLAEKYGVTARTICRLINGISREREAEVKKQYTKDRKKELSNEDT